jgi:cobalamin biosynthetic protein CobC
MVDSHPVVPPPTPPSDQGRASPFHWHGGALTEATRHFGDPGPGGWMDLSTGIAPISYPLGSIAPDAWTSLPDRGARDAFAAAVRGAHALPTEAAVLPLAGEQAALQWLPLCGVVAKGPVVVPDPGYGGHGEAWEAAGYPVERRADPLDRVGQAPVLVVINPNNPDGRTWAPSRLLEAAQAQAAMGGLLIVDEAFGEVAPDLTLCGKAGTPGLVILRSLGKFFGLPGVRFGWATGPSDLLATLDRRMGPWSVSGPALDIAARAEADVTWRAAQVRRLKRRAATLERILRAAGFALVGGTDLFKLVEVPAVPGIEARARWWMDGLAREGILTRPFIERAGWLRLGLPPDRAGEARLRKALETVGQRARARA